MKRRALSVLLFLLTGAMMTIAVALCAAWFSEIKFRPEPREMRAMWRHYPWQELGRLPQGSPHSGFGYMFFTSWDNPASTATLTVMRAGWPAHALDAHAEGTLPEYPQPQPSIVFNRPLNAVHQDPKYPRRALPLRPLWPGFAINTIFYAAIAWAGWMLCYAAPFALRRRLRIRRGQCTACGYSLRGRENVSDICPECGARA